MLINIIALLLILCIAGVIQPCLCNGGCLENERRALLAIKADMYQPPPQPGHSHSWLSSWTSSGDGDDCCTWRGVRCHNVTGHVTKIDLRYPDDWFVHLPWLPSGYLEFNDALYPGPSKLNPSIHVLMHLKYLDLSMNNFDAKPIPEFIGSLTKLEYLNLSHAHFSDTIPPQIGNLSSLRRLDLNMRYPYYYSSLTIDKSSPLLSRFRSLRYIDMSYVDLSMASENLFRDLNMLPSLSVLKLSSTGLDGSTHFIVDHFNFTSLEVLDLSYNWFRPKEIPSWLLNISSLVSLSLAGCGYAKMQSLEMLINSLPQLELLDLSENQLEGSIPETIAKLVHLQVLLLSDNNISGEIPGTALGNRNLSNLQVLDLSGNNIDGVIPAETFANLVHLQVLYLPYNNIGGVIPKTIANLVHLEVLHLSENNISGVIPETIGKLHNLQVLYMRNNRITGQIPAAAIGRLCKLMYLDLGQNYIGGEVTALIDGMSKCNPLNNKESQQGTASLHMLDLSNNNLNMTIPESLGKLSTSLFYLDLSSNSFTGNLTESHFSNLTNLDLLDISYNHFQVTLDQSWLPPFNASYIRMCSCRLGPGFPSWIQTQKNLGELCISEAGISDSFPAWLWDLHFWNLNASHNQIRGHLPPSLQAESMVYLDLSYNKLDGHVPLHVVGRYSFEFFSLSNNGLSGSLPSYFCKFSNLVVLDLSSNNFSGRVPLCQNNTMHTLEILDLSNNNLSGYIPDAFGTYTSLQSLHLRNNSINGTIPSSLKHCKKLAILDLGENKLSGRIPKLIGVHLLLLRVLRLRSNFFQGKIPVQILRLASLQVLDLAHNLISTTLTPSLGRLKAMSTTAKFEEQMYTDSQPMISYYKESLLVTTKGFELEYSKFLSLVVSIDLSSNSLYGEIPEELTHLSGLVFLNLSGNHFSGRIPKNIGAMAQLESLDLSINNLSGKIPSSMSILYSLSRLNLSSNNLSGAIPSGNQLQTFDPTSYSDNPALCGFPLPQCSRNGPSQDPGKVEEKEDKSEMIWHWASIALGFIVGFWGIVGALMIKLPLRTAYFHFIDNTCDWIYVKVVVKFNRLRSMMVKDGM